MVACFLVCLHAKGNWKLVIYILNDFTISYESYIYLQMRTTNDVEGWHNNLHNHAGQKYNYNGLNLYLVLDVLYCEALQVEKTAAKLLQGQKRIRTQRLSYRILNRKLFTAWKKHSQLDMDTEQLLNECAAKYTNMNAKSYRKSADDDRELELEVE